MNKKVVLAFIIGYGVGRVRPRKFNSSPSHLSGVIPIEFDETNNKIVSTVRKMVRNRLPFKETCEFPGCRWAVRSKFPDDLPELLKKHWELDHPNLSS